MTRDDVEELLSHLDEDGDGLITYEGKRLQITNPRASKDSTNTLPHPTLHLLTLKDP